MATNGVRDIREQGISWNVYSNPFEWNQSKYYLDNMGYAKAVDYTFKLPVHKYYSAP